MEPTIPRIAIHRVKTDDLLLVKTEAERECQCNAAQRLVPEVTNVCRACEARDLLWKIESWKKRQ